jgi:DNA uptake protein ComE-like DNA-binding protein
MKKAILLTLGIGAGFAASRLIRRWDAKGRRAVSPSTEFPRLLDLNDASNEELSGLGLEEAMVTNIVENRPYRNKLDLVSRLVIPENEYARIRHQIGVREAYEPIKVA